MLGSFAANATMEDVRIECNSLVFIHSQTNDHPQLRNLLVFNEARVRKWKTFSSLFAAICMLLLGTLAVMRVRGMIIHPTHCPPK